MHQSSLNNDQFLNHPVDSDNRQTLNANEDIVSSTPSLLSFQFPAYAKLLAVISLATLLFSIVTMSSIFASISKAPVYTSTNNMAGVIDPSMTTRTLVASTTTQALYEVNRTDGSHSGFARRFFVTPGDQSLYYDVEFVVSNSSRIPFAGKLTSTTNQYTVVTSPQGERFVLIPSDYNLFQTFMNNPQTSGSVNLNVLYEKQMFTIILSWSETGRLSALPLQVLPSRLGEVMSELYTKMQTAGSLDQAIPKGYKPQVNKLCVVIHCGVSGLLDIAGCIAEVSGPQAVVGWLLCGGQTIMAGCACLNCWGDCNAS
jgi:hypothetical protein